MDNQTVEKMRDWRRDFHANPELAYKENRTSAIVAGQLKSLGYEVHEGIAETGIVAVKYYGDGPSIALRADMDALPITEANDVSYVSGNAGIMHACGHDGHTAMLMGAAELLAERDDLSGSLYLIFQPAEENEGGARAMVEAGIFEQFKIDSVYGLHNMPGIEIGKYYARTGPTSAAFDTFDIHVAGKGGHGALPENTKDPIVAAAALVGALNTIVSRAVKPLDAAVITVGQINGGETYNVIPDTVSLMGSCRSLTTETQALVESRVKEVCAGIASTYGVEINCKYEQRYPPVVNSKKEAEAVVAALRTFAKDENIVSDFEPVMGSEDFAFFLAEKPGCYFLIGNGFDCGNLHSPTYDFNDDALSGGAKAWVAIASEMLKK